MSPAHQRGLLLLQQGRYELADREFRQDLAQAPDNPLSHAFLSLCLTRSRREVEALREADEAVRCGPDLAFCHYVRGCALQAKKRLKEAEAAVSESIRLDPEDADYPALLAAIALERRDWKGGLEAANRGLALDAEHATCLNLRAMALVQLGRKDEASETLGSALADDPENALTHANQGWALLHRGDHGRALEHFREALRIDPEMEWARAGIVEALKARFWIYRVMLGFFLWMGRQSSVAQWVMILGFVFGRKLLAEVAQAVPKLAPFIAPILALSFAFLIMTWIASPLFNLTLRFNRFGRMALSREQTVQSTWIGACFFLALALFATSLVTRSAEASLGMMYFGFLLFPLAVTFRLPPGRPRFLGAAYAAAVALVGGLGLAWVILAPGFQPGVDLTPVSLLTAFFWGSVLSTWLGGILGRTSL